MDENKPLPIAFMYGIFTFIWLFLMVKYMVNVGKHTIHGSYGLLEQGGAFQSDHSTQNSRSLDFRGWKTLLNMV